MILDNSHLITYLAYILLSFLSFMMVVFLLTNIVNMPKLIMKLPKEQQTTLYMEYITNVNSITHAVSTFCLSVIIVSQTSMNLPGANTHSENLVLSLSIGYFLSDTLLGFIYGYNDVMTVVHHVIALILFPYSIIKNQYGTLNAWCFVIAEISNPFLLVRNNLLKHEGYETLKLVAGLIFTVTFLVMRVFGLAFWLSKFSVQVPVCL